MFGIWRRILHQQRKPHAQQSVDSGCRGFGHQALTHSTRWRAGVVNAPVTDWRNYDSIYTERYMKVPEHNPDGYRQSAPRFTAAQLAGPILLMHGEIDDNVHMQNSIQFAYDLQLANKPFQLMIYPRTRHGVSDRSLLRHATQTMLDFLLAHTTPPAPPRPDRRTWSRS